MILEGRAENKKLKTNCLPVYYGFLMQSETEETKRKGAEMKKKSFFTVKLKLFCNIRLFRVKYIGASEEFEFKGCFEGLVALANLSDRTRLLSKI